MKRTRACVALARRAEGQRNAERFPGRGEREIGLLLVIANAEGLVYVSVLLRWMLWRML